MILRAKRGGGGSGLAARDVKVKSGVPNQRSGAAKGAAVANFAGATMEHIAGHCAKHEGIGVSSSQPPVMGADAEKIGEPAGIADAAPAKTMANKSPIIVKTARPLVLSRLLFRPLLATDRFMALITRRYSPYVPSAWTVTFRGYLFEIA